MFQVMASQERACGGNNKVFLSSYYLTEKHYRLKVIGEIYSFNTGQIESSHLFIYF